MANTDIWITDIIFYIKNENKKKKLPDIEYKVDRIITRRIPIKFLLNDKVFYERIIRDISITTKKTLIVDKETGLFKFKINYIKKIGETN